MAVSKKTGFLDSRVGDDYYVWTGGGDGTTWGDPNNWDDTTTSQNPATSAPSGGDNAEIGSASLTGSGAIGTLTIGGQVVDDAMLTASTIFSDGALTIDTTLTTQSYQQFQSNDTVASGVMLNATGNTDGILSHDGSFTVESSGSVATSSFVQVYSISEPILEMRSSSKMTASGGQSSYQPGGEPPIGLDIEGLGMLTDADLDSPAGFVVVGDEGAGAVLDLASGSTLQASSTTIGPYAGDNGTLIVDGSKYRDMSGGLYLGGGANAGFGGGDGGSAVLEVKAGGTVTESTFAILGQSKGSSGTATVTGMGALWLMNNLTVAASGSGQLKIMNGGSVKNSGALLIGQSASSSGTVSISDAAAMLAVTGSITVGQYGSGSLRITNGGTVSDGGDLEIGQYASASGSVSVDGTGSKLTVTDSITVGDAGLGALSVTNHGTVTGDTLIVAAQSGSSTTAQPDVVTVSGANASLIIANNATVDSATPSDDGSSGSWSYGPSGYGEVNVANGGYVSIGKTLTLQAPGTNAPPVLMVTSGGGIEIGGANGFQTDTLQIDSGGVVVGHGKIESINSNTGSPVPNWSLHIVNEGTIEAKNGNLTLDGNVDGSGKTRIDNNATLELGGTFAKSSTITFDPSATGGVLRLDDPTEFKGALTGMQPGEQIEIPDSAITNGSIVAAPIVQMGSVQTLLIFEGQSIAGRGTVPSLVLPNIAIDNPEGNTSLDGDYFNISQSPDGLDTVLTLEQGPRSGFIIDTNYDASVANLATNQPTLQSNFEIGVETAALCFEHEFTNSMTTDLWFGWGEVNGTAVANDALGQSIGSAGSFTYGQLRAAVAATDTTSPVQTAAVQSLPTADPTGGVSFDVTTAEQKALGLPHSTDVEALSNNADGKIGLSAGTNWSWNQGTIGGNQYDAVAVFEHEISEVFGRTASGGVDFSNVNGANTPMGGPVHYNLLDLFRYTAADGGSGDASGAPVGERDEPFVSDYLHGAGPLKPGEAGDNAYSYFSWNGKTITKQFELPSNVQQGFDVADWDGDIPGDAFGSGYNGTVGTISAPDLQAMNVLGYTIPGITCFVTGTRILTERREIPVEALRIDDRVATASGNALTPIVWVGHRHVVCARYPDPHSVWPVRVRAGAFDDDTPHHDLLLSPDHAVFVHGVLIPVRLLINGTSIAPEPMDELTYYHVELPRHDLLRAEGLSVESYLDCGDRWNFMNDRGVIRLFPDFAARLTAAAAWEGKSCAPMVLSGPLLAAARAQVNGRAARSAARHALFGKPRLPPATERLIQRHHIGR